MQSVSDNIMLGQLCPLGTGSFSLLLDEQRLADAVDVAAGYDGLDADRGSGQTPGTNQFHMLCLEQHSAYSLASYLCLES